MRVGLSLLPSLGLHSSWGNTQALQVQPRCHSCHYSFQLCKPSFHPKLLTLIKRANLCYHIVLFPFTKDYCLFGFVCEEIWLWYNFCKPNSLYHQQGPNCLPLLELFPISALHYHQELVGEVVGEVVEVVEVEEVEAEEVEGVEEVVG